MYIAFAGSPVLFNSTLALLFAFKVESWYFHGDSTDGLLVPLFVYKMGDGA